MKRCDADRRRIFLRGFCPRRFFSKERTGGKGRAEKGEFGREIAKYFEKINGEDCFIYLTFFGEGI